MTEMLDNLDALCRLCMSVDGRIPIFSDGKNKDDLAARIFECVSIQIEHDGKLPTNVCSPCLSCIESWYTFKQKCHQTQDTLSSMVAGTLEDGITPCNGDSEGVVKESISSEESSESLPELTRTGKDTRDEATRDMENPGQCGILAVVDAGGSRLDVNNLVANDSEVLSDVDQNREQVTPGEHDIQDGSSEATQPYPENFDDHSTHASSEDTRNAGTDKTADSAATEIPEESGSVEKSNSQSETEMLTIHQTTNREEEASDLDNDSRDEVMEEDEEEEYDDFVDEEDFDEPVSAQLVNPKFAAKSMSAKPDSSLSSLQRPPGNVQTVDLCEDDDDVCVVEPVVQKITIEEVESNDSVKNEPEENPDELKTNQVKGEINLRIESAVTLPGDLMEKGEQPSESRDADEAAVPGDAQSELITTARSSRDNSPDRMSGDGSMIEDDQFEDDESSQLLPPALGDSSRATPDSTMVSSNTEEPEPYIPLAFDNIKQEVDRGYADEDVSQGYNQVKTIQGKSREEYERELLSGDNTVDVNNDRCIICDHKFHSISSLLRHTKCKTHVINKTIVMKREMGAPIDPSTQALHDRHMQAYRNQWNNGKRKSYPTQAMGGAPRRFACKLCRVVAISSRDYERHKASKKHKLCVMMGGLPIDENSLQKPPARKIIKPQLLQYGHVEPPQHKTSGPKSQHGQREYICPIPNCGYVCFEGSILLTHMTSHGIQGQGPSPQPTPTQLPSLTHKPTVPTPTPPISVESKPASRSGKYENLFCKYHNVYFETARGYLNHIRTCTMAPPISNFLKKENSQSAESLQRYCKLCDLSFSTSDMLIQHMNVYHKGANNSKDSDFSKFKVIAPVYTPKPMQQKNRKHKCHLCGKVFNLLHSLNFHLRTHQSHVTSSTSTNTTCKVCKKVFATRKSCASHLKTHFLPPGSNKLFCSTCYKTFNTRVEICRHRYDGTCIAQPISGESFPCGQCNLSFKDATILSNHKLRFHPDIKEEKVDEEGNIEEAVEEQAKAEEYREEAAATPQPEVPQVTYKDGSTKCMLCGKGFSSFLNMKRHCRFIHRMPEANILKMAASMGISSSKMSDSPTPGEGGPQPFSKKSLPHDKSCNRCGETFYHSKQLLDHQQVCQEPVRKACQQCGMPTDAQGCPHCDGRAEEAKNSGGSSSLLFKCPIGHMSFNDENAMLKHYSYCTGKCGPYFECGSCGCEFRYRKNFDIHDCALSRKKTTYNCTECHRSFTKKSYLMNHEMKCPHLNSPGGFSEPSAPPPTTPQPHPTSSNSLKKTRQSCPDEPHVELPTHSDKPLEVFTCEQCEKIFHSHKALNGHMWIHKQATPENKMFCKFCGRENLSLNSLYSHVYKCVRSLFMTEEVLTCEDCSTFLSRYDTPKELSAKLHVHVLNCYPIPWYQNEGEVEGSDKILCYICCHAFSSVESLTIHKIQHKKAKAKRNSSPFCKSSAKKRPKYGHFSAPKIEIDINDMIEEEVFESEDSCTSANTTSTLATKFILNCQVCNRQFHNIDKLRNHEKVHGIVRQVVNESEDVDVVNEA